MAKHGDGVATVSCETYDFPPLDSGFQKGSLGRLEVVKGARPEQPSGL